MLSARWPLVVFGAVLGGVRGKVLAWLQEQHHRRCSPRCVRVWQQKLGIQDSVEQRANRRSRLHKAAALNTSGPL
ncbi:hypothetical protein GUJ93_ZPchr0005g15264 [Zizania palustris]|uniref:Uncharacterized protein n=1 Tax=Zizania palustris TaxID=103762 RepID=A0A8J5SHS4_ZIZPA|nr:hypothetical protein GUJ93_ZPchr0005g15264 [Zizania palustris]